MPAAEKIYLCLTTALRLVDAYRDQGGGTIMSTSHEESAKNEELTGTQAGEARLGEGEQQGGPSARRRDILAKSLGVAAAAVGAGAVLDLSAGTAQASTTKAGVFASSTAGTPAVKAT